MMLSSMDVIVRNSLMKLMADLYQPSLMLLLKKLRIQMLRYLHSKDVDVRVVLMADARIVSCHRPISSLAIMTTGTVASRNRSDDHHD